MDLRNTTTQHFSPAKAEETAAMMTANEAGEADAFTYTADHDPKGTGYSRIIVTDEDGEFVAIV